LRRYVDLVNQWQLLACCQHGVAAKLVAPFKPKDADLYAVVQGFDDTYSAYADHQNRMERFWCLRWLQQEKRDRAVASVIKGDLVRLDEIPLMMHVPGLGVHARGTKLLLAIADFDELMIEASCRVLQVLDAPAATNEALEALEEALEEEAQEEAQEGNGVDVEGDIDIEGNTDADAGATAQEPLEGADGADVPQASSGDGNNAADGASGASGASGSSADEPVEQA